MDDAEYRRLCSAPDVMRRTDIRATASRLRVREPKLARELDRILASDPVPKPLEHDAGPDTDYLWLDLDAEDVEGVHEALRDLESQLVQDPDADQTALTWVAELADRWNNAESSRPDAV